jgi:hypothetical protein
VLTAILRDAAPHLSADLREHATAMNICVAIASLLLLVGSFAAHAPQHGPQLATEQSHALEPAAGPDSMDSRHRRPSDA